MQAQLAEKIKHSPGGLITYADYIAMALYTPEIGYYMREGEKIGRSGDFITSSNVSDIYGRTLSKWYKRMVDRHGLAAQICEVGGGNGRFAKAFLEEWYSNSGMELNYTIVETSPLHRKLQQELLSRFPGFSQPEALSAVNIHSGLLFSNELFDALPVHVIEKQDGKLYEIMIGSKDGKLYEQQVELNNPAIDLYLERNRLTLADRQRIEIPLSMEGMVKDMAFVLGEGLVVTVDYGYTNEEWMEPGRRNGSLRGYMKHRMFDSVLEYPGEMDITTHIHLDGLVEAGNRHGLDTMAILRQDEFLFKAGILKELEDNYDPNPFSERSKRNRAIRSLVMPSGMSSSFHVVIQQKGLAIKLDELY
ncbi:cytoplasmic protein [Bacillus sp. FJAT-18017]|nr:SAM-dependent methyltransferase [Bacillus sp. FJAT-18017]ALC92727.1 cytoplasmic protein [Bacillus sp. FJAT-18017]